MYKRTIRVSTWTKPEVKLWNETEVAWNDVLVNEGNGTSSDPLC